MRIQQVVDGKVDPIPERRIHGIGFANLGKVFSEMLEPDVLDHAAAEKALFGQQQIRFGSIGGEDAIGDGIFVQGRELIHQHGDGIGFLTGGAARRPDPDPGLAGPILFFGEGGQKYLFEQGKERGLLKNSLYEMFRESNRAFASMLFSDKDLQ